MRIACLLIALLPGLFLAPAPLIAQERGTLNPEEMTMGRIVEDIRAGRTSMTNCAAGYLMTKSGRHAPARETFDACASAGYARAMTWMGYMDENGYAGPRDPAAAAEWDRRAAEAGDPIGAFNHGLALIRGHGVAADPERGREMVDAAAKAGLEAAQRLRAAGYDPDEVTPDADEWKYLKAY